MSRRQELPDSPTARIPGAAVELLRAAVLGDVLVAGNEEYEGARAVWNGMIDRRPAVIVRCKGEADVSAAVVFARDHHVPVSIRGGGHNVAGHAVCDNGVMIDLSSMRGVRVDPENRRARVEGGAIWRDVDGETQTFGLAVPGGLISDTGVAGLTLSGGIGWLRSRYGLTIDSLVSADVVTADGRLVRASADENADLLWALKGGGGNFGVVTAFEFALHEAGPKLMFCAPLYAVSAGSEPIRFWREFLADKADDVGSLIEFSTIPHDPDYPERFWGERIYTIAAVYAGEAEEGERLLEPLRGLGDLVADFSGQMDYCDIQQLFDTLIPFGQYRCYWKSRYLSGLSDAAIDVIVEGNATPPSPNTLSSIWAFGGATARVASADSAFGDRSMPYMLSIDSIWAAPEDDEANIAWTREFWERTSAYSDGGRIYLNFPGLGEEGDELVRRSYGANFARLVEIKTKYDPANVFRFNQNIRPG
ncbi:MAG: FAD-binding oxidoreductase [Actinomycetota bacterium]|nr:FAD-binding oxidoreductase [Actinomycetota bacterium]